MSTIDVLVEVIEEVHDAERSLRPGDIPDRVVFKHVKTLWQLLLGIDEVLFDSHNYEDFKLTFENKGETFTAYTYLGSDFNSVQRNIHNAIGSPIESMKIVRILDNETNSDSDETSVSFKLSMLNKIRYTVFRHHMVVNEVLNEAEIIDAIASYMRHDILNTSNDLSISLQSNSTIFDNCYRECLENLLLNDDSVTIQDMATEALELFKRDAGVAYFFNFKIAMRYHEQMVDLVKRIFKKHEYVDLEIDDYYRHNPILPILKPFFRSLAMETVNIEPDHHYEKVNPSGRPDVVEDSSNLLIEKLNLGMVNEILQQVTNSELENYEGSVPITLKFFDKIIHFYCKSKLAEGGTDVENDDYIVLIKGTIIKWIEGDIDTPLFISQLADLSLIPTALPYTFHEVQFPNVHMRMALHQVKENIRILETYFLKWKVSTEKNTELYKFYEKWKPNATKKKYIQLWQKKMHKMDQLESRDISSIYIYRVKIIFDQWRNSTANVQMNMKIAQEIRARKVFEQWQNCALSLKSMSDKATTLYEHKLLMKYMTRWIDAKISSFPDKLKEFNLIQKRNLFNFWKHMISKHQYMKQQAICLRETNSITHVFNHWKKRTYVPLKRLRLLDSMKNEFIIKKFFQNWKKQSHLNALELQLKKNIIKNLLKDKFEKWYRFKKLTDAQAKFTKNKGQGITKDYFKKWQDIYLLNQKAKDFYASKHLSKAFIGWKLKTIEKEVNNRHQFMELKRFWTIWKLKATAEQYKSCGEMLLIEKYFTFWRQKTLGLRENLQVSENAVPLIKTAVYFDFWRKQFNHNKRMVQIADEFKIRKFEASEIAVKRWMWNVLRVSFKDSRRKRLELKRMERVFQKRILAAYLNKMKMRMVSMELMKSKADNYNRLLLSSRYFDIWYARFDDVTVLHDLLISKLDTENVNLVTRIMSKMQLRMIKVRTDEANADRFKMRWDKMKTKTFFELWKLKLSSRTSPTPTARNVIHGGADPIPDLNPYIDLAPKDRGSPFFKQPLPSRMRSLLTGDVAEYGVEGQVSEEYPNMLQTPLNRRRMRSSSVLSSAVSTSTAFSSALRTPGMRKATSNRLLNYTRLSPEKIDASSLTSAERVRKRNLEERVSRYRLLKSPPKTGESVGDRLEKVVEENGLSRGDEIFDITDDSMMNTSTPIKS